LAGNKDTLSDHAALVADIWDAAPSKGDVNRPVMTREEQSVIDYLERDNGRPLTPQEAWLALEQARAVGELDG
jgi:hypothetical protein